MENHQLINQDSGKTEYYTPMEIVDACRWLMGGIALDPASSVLANKRVQADRYYTINDNGLTKPWFRSVWLNHPFSRTNNPLWVNKLVAEYEQEFLHMACCITFAATSERWFQPLMQYPQCYLSPRTNYYLSDGTKKRGVTKGSVVTFLGAEIMQIERIRAAFRGMGTVKV